MKAMKSEYGEKKGEKIFYASKNKGTISGVDRAHKSKLRSAAHKMMGGKY